MSYETASSPKIVPFETVLLKMSQIDAFKAAVGKGPTEGARTLMQIGQEVGQKLGRELPPEETYSLLFVTMARAMDYPINDDGTPHKFARHAPYSKPQHQGMQRAFEKLGMFLAL